MAKRAGAEFGSSVLGIWEVDGIVLRAEGSDESIG